MLLPASFSARIHPSMKNSVMHFFERFHEEISFRGTFPARQLLCRSIIERRTSCAKTWVTFVQNHSDSSRKKSSHETKLASQKKPENHAQTKWNHFRFLLQKKDEACRRPSASMLHPCNTGWIWPIDQMAPTENQGYARVWNIQRCYILLHTYAHVRNTLWCYITTHIWSNLVQSLGTNIQKHLQPLKGS